MFREKSYEKHNLKNTKTCIFGFKIKSKVKFLFFSPCKHTHTVTHQGRTHSIPAPCGSFIWVLQLLTSYGQVATCLLSFCCTTILFRPPSLSSPPPPPFMEPSLSLASLPSLSLCPVASACAVVRELSTFCCHFRQATPSIIRFLALKNLHSVSPLTGSARRRSLSFRLVSGSLCRTHTHTHRNLPPPKWPPASFALTQKPVCPPRLRLGFSPFLRSFCSFAFISHSSQPPFAWKFFARFSNGFYLAIFVKFKCVK